jgi:hypothetical protein
LIPLNLKETTMQYKTITLGMLEQRPRLHERLRKNRVLLQTMEQFADELKASHEAWKQLLAQDRPGCDPSQIASQALELAIEALERRLPSESPEDEMETLSLDKAMAFIQRSSPPA